MSREVMQMALDALYVATTPLAKDRQEVLQAQAALRARLAQIEPEPVREWQGLTDEEIQKLQHQNWEERWLYKEFARAIEAKLKEKNGE